MATTAAVRRVVTAPKSASSWPGLSGAGSAAAQMVMAGKLPDPNKWNVRRHKFFHRVDYAAAGQTSIQLFSNVSPSKFICNLPVQGSLPAETFFKLEAVRVTPETGVTSASNNAATTNAATTDAVNGHQSISRAATAQSTVDTVAGVIEDLRQVFAQGILTIKCGDRKIVDEVYGLHNFPSGSQVTVDGSYGGTTTANSNRETMLFQNGDPRNDNAWKLTPAFPILPQKQISGLLEWQAAFAVNDAFVLRVELEGVLLTPANG